MTLDLVLMCALSTLIVLACAFTVVRINGAKEELDVELSNMQGEVNHLEAVVVTLESRIDAMTTDMDEFFAVLVDLANTDERPVDEPHAPIEPSAFDMRIAQFREDLNTPTYSRESEPSYHPGVYDVPHDSVRDVPIKYEPEYAD